VRTRARAWLAAAALLAGCGTATSARPPATAVPAVTPSPLATSLTTARDAWAILPMSSDPPFWQVFIRPAAAARWRLATPPGVADNGGLVAAGAGGSLTVAVRPSQALTFSPLASSADGGVRWSPGLLDAGIAPVPGALAAAGRSMAAVLADGTVEVSADGGATWRAASAGHGCVPRGVTGVAFGIAGDVLAAGTCAGAGTGLFAYRGGRWQPVRLPAAGQPVRLAGGVVLVRQGTRLRAVWDTAAGWSASASLPAGDGLTTSGLLGDRAAWVLLRGGRAAVATRPGAAWRVLPDVPAGTAVLAAGPGGSTEALATAGRELSVWRLSGAAWRRAQTIDVPIQYGSSG
jgi:hypothetical protein